MSEEDISYISSFAYISNEEKLKAMLHADHRRRESIIHSRIFPMRPILGDAQAEAEFSAYLKRYSDQRYEDLAQESAIYQAQLLAVEVSERKLRKEHAAKYPDWPYDMEASC